MNKYEQYNIESNPKKQNKIKQMEPNSKMFFKLTTITSTTIKLNLHIT